MKIAIIGSGISGLSTAWFLQKSSVDITIFEKEELLGGHSQGVDIFYKSENTTKKVFVNPAYDIFNQPNYPQFTEILNKLNIPYEKQEFSYNFRCIKNNKDIWQAKLPLFLRLSNFLQLANPTYFKLVYFGTKVGKKATEFMKKPDSSTTLYDFLHIIGIPETLINTFFIPVFARPWGLKPSDMRHFPAEIVLGWVDKNKALTPKPVQWQTVSGGAKTYVEALVTKLKEGGVKFYTDVTNLKINRLNNSVNLQWENDKWAKFDQVILATNPKIAKNLIQDISIEEVNALTAFRYQKNNIIVHSDTRFLPKKVSDWSYFNVAYDIHKNDTYNSIWFGQRENVPVFATNYRSLPFDVEPDKVHNKFVYQQPIFDAQTAQNRNTLNKVQGRNNTWYVGCYLCGSSHHEDAIQSASLVANRIKKLLKPIPKTEP